MQRSSICIFLLTFCFPLFSQSENEKKAIIDYNQVDEPPVHPLCVTPSTEACSLNHISKFINDNFDQEIFGDYQPIINLKIKFIIDDSGKVVWATALSNSTKIRIEVERIIKKLPRFSPGKYDNENVSVVYLVPLTLKNYYKFPGSYKLNEVDEAPQTADCNNYQDKKKCISSKFSEIFRRNVSSENLPKGFHASTISIEVNKNGMISNFLVSASSVEMEKETLQLKQYLPKFNSGAMINGEKVNLTLNFPLMYGSLIRK